MLMSDEKDDGYVKQRSHEALSTLIVTLLLSITPFCVVRKCV